MGFSDYLLLAGILILAAFAARYAFKNRNRCCGDCTRCKQCSSCEKEERKRPG